MPRRAEEEVRARAPRRGARPRRLEPERPGQARREAARHGHVARRGGAGTKTRRGERRTNDRPESAGRATRGRSPSRYAPDAGRPLLEAAARRRRFAFAGIHVPILRGSAFVEGRIHGSESREGFRRAGRSFSSIRRSEPSVSSVPSSSRSSPVSFTGRLRRAEPGFVLERPRSSFDGTTACARCLTPVSFRRERGRSRGSSRRRTRSREQAARGGPAGAREERRPRRLELRRRTSTSSTTTTSSSPSTRSSTSRCSSSCR